MPALLIEDVSLFDGTGAPLRPHASVLALDGVVRVVGPVGSFRAPRDADRVDGRGRFLLPGLVDLHTHLLTRDAFRFLSQFGPRMREGDPERFARWFPAFGVTTIRDIGNYRGVLGLRKRIAEGRVIGPTVLAAGELLEGPEALWPLGRAFRTSREAVREVRRQAAMGVDWLKLYANVPPGLTRTIVREGHRLGLPVAGHIERTSARQAAAYRIDSLEHADTLIDDGFLPNTWRQRAPRRSGPRSWLRSEVFRWLHADFHGPAARELVATLRRNRTTISPTMIVLEHIFAEPERAYAKYGLDPMPSRWRSTWQGRYEDHGLEKMSRSDLIAVWRRIRAFVRLLRRAGVTIVPSTDAAGWNPYVAPGASLHRELAILRECGYSIQELLAMATSGAARSLQREWEFGTAAPGRRADLLLLRRNPLEDLANLRAIETVLLRGRPYAPGDMRP